jgi:hypothetical protein
MTLSRVAEGKPMGKKGRSDRGIKCEQSSASVRPTREEVLALPYWPRVAFCARVARRVLPLVERYWEREAPVDYVFPRPSYLRGVKKCVRQSERAAAHAAVLSEKALIDGREAAAIAAGYAEYAAELAERAPDSPPYAAVYAANTAHAAASGALNLLKPDWVCEWGLVIANAGEAGEVLGVSEELDAAIRADLETLKRLICDKGWTDQTPVPPRVFGPLWPQGPPQGWPEEE